MIYPKIPDEIYENRCRYCFHFCKDGENRDFDQKEEYSYSAKLPCRIHSIAGYSHQERVEDGTPRGSYEKIVYTDGECRSFVPHLSYPGICKSCTYHNCFIEGYCTTIKGDDYRRAFLVNGYGNKAYESDFYTCSKWKISERAKDYFLSDMVLERVPLIIDPKTFKLIAPHKISDAAKEWAVIRDKKMAEVEQKSKEQETIKKSNVEIEQMSLFD